MKRDQNFFERYSLVIGALAIFAVAIFVLTMKMSNMTQDIGTGDNGDTVELLNSEGEPVQTVRYGAVSQNEGVEGGG